MVVLKSGVALNLFGSVTVDMGYDCCSAKQFLNMHFFFQVQPQEDVPPTAQGSCCTEESLLPEAAG